MPEKRNTLLVRSGGSAALPEWRAAFAECAPELDVRDWRDATVNPDDVTYALVWEPEHGALARFRNLRLILSAFAGVDHLLADPDLPPHLPIVRMVTEETIERMGDFVAMAALALTRQLPALSAAQQVCRWDPRSSVIASFLGSRGRCNT